MAVGNFNLYSNAMLSLGSAVFNFTADTYQGILLTNSYVPSPNTHALYSDVSAVEVAAGGGYSTGGLTLGGVSWSLSTGSAILAAQSLSWPGSSISARYVAIVRRAGVTLVPGDKLLGYMDLNTGGGNVSSSGSTFLVNFSGSTPSSGGNIIVFSHTP